VFQAVGKPLLPLDVAGQADVVDRSFVVKLHDSVLWVSEKKPHPVYKHSTVLQMVTQYQTSSKQDKVLMILHLAHNKPPLLSQVMQEMIGRKIRIRKDFARNEMLRIKREHAKEVYVNGGRDVRMARRIRAARHRLRRRQILAEDAGRLAVRDRAQMLAICDGAADEPQAIRVI
jgi:hypothetical protein